MNLDSAHLCDLSRGCPFGELWGSPLAGGVEIGIKASLRQPTLLSSIHESSVDCVEAWGGMCP